MVVLVVVSVVLVGPAVVVVELPPVGNGGLCVLLVVEVEEVVGPAVEDVFEPPGLEVAEGGFVVDDVDVDDVDVGLGPHSPTMDGTASGPLPMATRLEPQ